MRWYFESSDEPRQFWDAKFEDGVVTLVTGVVGGERDTQTMDFDDVDEAVAELRALVMPIIAAGYTQSLAPDERYKPDPRIATFYAEELLDHWKSMGVAPGEPNPYRDLWREYLAAELPPELDQFLGWRSTHDFGYCNYGEWRIWDADRWLPEAAHGNLFEQLVVSDQQNYLGTAMMEHFAGWVFVGSAGNGDQYFAHPDHGDPDRAEIVFFDHETHNPECFIADSLSSLAWLNRCYLNLDDEDFDHEQLSADFGLIEDRTQPSWHYSALEDELGLEPSFEGKSRGIFYFYRAIWLDQLLRPNRMGVEDIEDVYYADIHAGLRFQDALNSPYLRSAPVTALYWIWRLWWFDKPELESCLAVTAEHASPIVRDCTALIREFQSGRKSLGEIEDIFARRDEFLALDLDPDRAEARAEEEAEATRRAEVELAEQLEKAHRIIASGSVETVREAAWEFTDQPDVLEVLYEFLEHEDPAVGLWIRRAEFLSNAGSTREGRSYSFEDDEVREVIARDGAIIAPLYADPSEPYDLPMAARAAGLRMKPALVSALASRDKYWRGAKAAAEGLAAMGATDQTAALIELLDEIRWDRDDHIAQIQRSDALLAVIEALGELGGDDARDALLRLLDTDLAKVRPRTLRALGILGDPTTVDAIIGHLGTATRPALFALAHIGSDAARTAVDAHLATLAGPLTQLAYEHAMAQLAAHHAGDEADWALVRRLTRVVEANRYDDLEFHLTLIHLLHADPERDAAVALIGEYLHDDRPIVRDAALAALSIGDDSPRLRWLDRPAVDALFAAEGVEGLRSALADPRAVFRHNALRKAIDEGVGADVSAEACALVRLVCRFTDYTNGYLQDASVVTHAVIEALAHVGTEEADRLLCQLWRGGNVLYADADVLKYDRDDIQSRLQPYVEEVEAARAANAPPAAPRRRPELFVRSPWVFGGCVNGLAWSPDGEQLAVGGEGGVKLFGPDGDVVRAFADVNGAWVYDVAFHPDGTLIAAGAHAGHLWLLDPETGSVVATLKGHSGVPCGVRRVSFSRSGDQLASVSDDRSLRIWNVASRECTMVWEDPADVNAVDWVTEDLVVIGTDRMLRLISTSGDEVDSQSCSKVAEVRVSRALERIYVGAAGHLRAFGLDLSERRSDDLASDAVTRIRLRTDELVATSWEGEGAGVSFVPYDGGDREHLSGHRAPSFALDLRPASGDVYAGGRPGVVARWTAHGEPLTEDRAFHTDEISSIAFSGTEILTSSDDQTAIRWSADGDALAVYRSPQGRLSDVTVDGAHVYVTGPDFAGCFTLGGKLIWSAKPARSEALAVTDDAVVVASYNELWWLDRQTGEVVHQSGAFANSFIFRWARLDARRLAVAGYDDHKLFVWDLASRELLETWDLPPSERGGICGIAIASDRLFVARWDKTIVVLDASNGAVLRKATLPGTRYPIAANADASQLYATAGSMVEIYDTSTFEVVAHVDVGAKLEVLAVAPDGQWFFGAGSGEIFTG